MINKEFILSSLDCQNAEEAFEVLGNLLYEGGAVKETFVNAVNEREKRFPTGLPAAVCDIAIPHTDSVHVNFSAIAVGILKEPIEFIQMGSTDIVLHPEIILMLAIKDPHDQIILLRKLMSLFQNNILLGELRKAESKDRIYEILKNYMEKEG